MKHWDSFLKQLILLLDAMVIFAAFLGTYYLRQHWHSVYNIDLFPGEQLALGHLRSFESYLWFLLFIIPVLLSSLHLMGAYVKFRMRTDIILAWIVLKAHLISALLFIAFIFLFRLQYVSRSFVAVFFVLSFVFIVAERLLFIAVFRMRHEKDYFQRKILIVGTGRRTRSFIKRIKPHMDMNLKIVGVVDLDSSLIGQQVMDLSVLGTVEDIPTLIKEQVIDEVVFVIPRNWLHKIESVVLECERIGVRTTFAVDLFDMQFAKPMISQIDGIPLLSFDTTPLSRWKLALKYSLDAVAASAGLILLAPLFLLVAILIKLTSPGPVFFGQIRCGYNGRLFKVYKFRSMVLDAEARQAELRHLNELKGPVFKITNDPRLTAIGAWLRQSSIDELPQLFNVLKGEMSLVGPRPPLPEEVKQYEPWQRRRLSMRPGITGNWQANGRNHIKDFNVLTELDLEYIDKWSLLLDLRLLVKTIPAVLFRIGAK